MSKFTYMMSDNYCQNWDRVDAIREVIANAIDSGDILHIGWANRVGTVTNKGILGIDKLLIGESSKRGSSEAIGQFGEGFKIAALVFAREGSKFDVTSGSKNYTFTSEFSPDFGKRILTVNVEDCEETEETEFRFECPEKEFMEAKNLFRKFADVSEIGETGILNNQGDIYVLGVKIGKEGNTIFGYDFNDKSMVNRDRKTVGSYRIHSAIGTCISRCEKEEVVEAILDAQNSVTEKSMYLYPNTSVLEVWKSVVEKRYGDKIAIASSIPNIDALAEYNGYKLVSHGRFINDVIKSATNAKDASEVIPESFLEDAIPVDKLDRQFRNCIRLAEKKFIKIFGHPPAGTILVSDRMKSDQYAQVSRIRNTIVLNEEITGNPARIFHAFCHEKAHITSFASDCTSEFESALGDMLEKFAEKMIFRKRKKRRIL